MLLRPWACSVQHLKAQQKAGTNWCAPIDADRPIESAWLTDGRANAEGRIAAGSARTPGKDPGTNDHTNDSLAVPVRVMGAIGTDENGRTSTLLLTTWNAGVTH